MLDEGGLAFVMGVGEGQGEDHAATSRGGDAGPRASRRNEAESGH